MLRVALEERKRNWSYLIRQVDSAGNTVEDREGEWEKHRKKRSNEGKKGGRGNQQKKLLCTVG